MVVLAAGLNPPRLEVSVPLRLTDLATVVGAYALWSQRHWAYALTYYWGLVLSSQALISPALDGPDFPSFGFLAFWSIHLLVVWAAIYLTWGRGLRPTWRSYRMVAVVSLTWTVFHDGLQRRRRLQLRISQSEALDGKSFRPDGPVAVVCGSGHRVGAGGVGTDDLAVERPATKTVTSDHSR